MFTRKFIAPIFVFALFLALCLVKPVFADDGSTTDADGTVASTAIVDEETVISRDSDRSTVDGDPYFTVGTVTYNFYKSDSGVDCSTDPTHCKLDDHPIQAALDYMSNNNLTPSDRKLHIEEDVYVDDVVVDGSKPGLKGLTGLVGEGGNAEIDGSLTIHDTMTGFSLEKLTVKANSELSDQIAIYSDYNYGTITLKDVNAVASGEDGVGIYIYQVGNIVLNRVTSNNNGYQGAQLLAEGSITVLNSEFSFNLKNVNDGNSLFDEEGEDLGTTSLLIEGSSAPIVLNGVSAEWNTGDGVVVYGNNKTTVTIKNSALNYNNVSYDEGTDSWSKVRSGWGNGYGYGLYVWGGVINLENIDAERNAQDGINAGAHSTFTGSRLITDNNFIDGIYISTCIWIDSDSYACDNAGPGTVIVKTSTGSYNGGSGVYIESKGAVTIYDSYYSNNGFMGVYVDNSMSSVAVPVTLTMVTSNDNPGGDGFNIYTKGSVTATNLVADNNGAGFGEDATNDGNGINIVVFGSGAVTFRIDTSTPMTFNETIGNHAHGLNIYTSGPVTLTGFDSTKNGAYGAFIDNRSATTTAPVTINVVDTINSRSSFSENGGYGLQILSNGVINVSYVDIARNEEYGARFSNIPVFGTGKPAVTILGSSFYENCAVDGDGNCYDDGNSTHYGLTVASLGAINITNLYASNNYGLGVSLDNDQVAGTVGVTLKSIKGYQNVISGNLGDGLEIFTYGPTTITLLTAESNSGTGLQINGLGTGAITITDGYFNSNVYGVSVQTSGPITWKNGSASDNYYYGAVLTNPLGGKPVVVTSVTTDGNGETGLRITSTGAVTLTNVESNNNSANYYIISDGEDWTDNLDEGQVWRYSAAVDVTLNIDVTSDRFIPYFFITDGEGNTIDGSDWVSDNEAFKTVDLIGGQTYQIHILSNSGEDSGSVYWIGVYIGSTVPSWPGNVSAADGISIINPSTGGAPVTVKNNTNPWNGNNSGYGLSIISSGIVSVSNIRLDNNGKNGLMINNMPASSARAVNITSVEAVGNYDNGVFVQSKGVITVKDSFSIGNNNFGMSLTNINMTPSAVSLKGVYSIGNGSTGIQINSSGAVTLYDVSSNNNYGRGVAVQTNGVVTLTGIYTSDNSDNGLRVETQSAVTVNKFPSRYNVFSGNGSDGLYISTKGKVTLNNIYAENNGFWAYDEEGDYYYPSTDAYGIQVNNANNELPQAVIATDIFANRNTKDGIKINTSGAVTITRLQSANENVENGLTVSQMKAATGSYAIVIKQATTNSNTGRGIFVYGAGNITLSRFESDYNQGDAGVELSNVLGTGTVTILAPVGGKTANLVMFNFNGDGVKINSNGAVTVSGLEVLGNGNRGLNIYNSLSSGTPVTLNTITARANGGSGIAVKSTGVVTINKSWTIANHEHGMTIETTGNTFIKDCGSISNSWAGMFVYLKPSGNLTLTNSTWFGNLKESSYGYNNLQFDGALLTIN